MGQASAQVTALIQLAEAAACLADMPTAERSLREALALSLRLNGNRHVDTFHVETRLARLLHETGRRRESWELHDSMLSRVAQTKEASTPQLMSRLRRYWAASLLDEGRTEEAAAVFREDPQGRPRHPAVHQGAGVAVRGHPRGGRGGGSRRRSHAWTRPNSSFARWSVPRPPRRRWMRSGSTEPPPWWRAGGQTRRSRSSRGSGARPMRPQRCLAPRCAPARSGQGRSCSRASRRRRSARQGAS